MWFRVSRFGLFTAATIEIHLSLMTINICQIQLSDRKAAQGDQAVVHSAANSVVNSAVKSAAHSVVDSASVSTSTPRESGDVRHKVIIHGYDVRRLLRDVLVGNSEVTSEVNSVIESVVNTVVNSAATSVVNSRRATLGRSQDVCKASRSTIEGKRCVVSSRPLFRRSDVNEAEEKK